MCWLAYEAAGAGLLSPELAASIWRLKGVKKLGLGLGIWLTAEQELRFWQAPDPNTLKGKRDRTILAGLAWGGFDAASWQIQTSGICSSTKTIGPLWISS